MAKLFLSCKVLSVTPVSAGIFRLDCDWAGSPPGNDPRGGPPDTLRAGQFFMVKPESSGVFLARPISAAFWDHASGKPPADGTQLTNENPLSCRKLSFLILRRGKGTEELAALRPGETIELSGPLGNCWEDFLPPAGTPTDADGAKPDKEKPCALIGGGIGIAPLLSLPLRYPSRFDFYAGFRTISGEEEAALLGPIKPFVNKLTIAVEFNPASPLPHTKTQGHEGKIPDFLNPADYSAVCACGPEAMLRAVAEKCAAAGVPCYVSMERRMACGAGACLGCTVSTSEGNRRCCADGPIFPAGAVLF